MSDASTSGAPQQVMPGVAMAGSTLSDFAARADERSFETDEFRAVRPRNYKLIALIGGGAAVVLLAVIFFATRGPKTADNPDKTGKSDKIAVKDPGTGSDKTGPDTMSGSDKAVGSDTAAAGSDTTASGSDSASGSDTGTGQLATTNPGSGAETSDTGMGTGQTGTDTGQTGTDTGQTGTGRTGTGQTGTDTGRTGTGQTGTGRTGTGRTGTGATGGNGRTGNGRTGNGRTGTGRVGTGKGGTGTGETAAVAKGPDPEVVAKARAAYDDGNKDLIAGRFDAAIAQYKEALSLYPGFAAGYRQLGLAYAEQGNKAKALQALRSYLSAAPNAKDADLIRKRIAGLGGQ